MAARKKTDTTQLFNQRKAHTAHGRVAGSKPPKSVVLIVTEDKKSSKFYFEQMQRVESERLIFNIKTVHGGQLPSIIEKLEEKASCGEVFDKAYGVFDVDVFDPAHPTHCCPTNFISIKALECYRQTEVVGHLESILINLVLRTNSTR